MCVVIVVPAFAERQHRENKAVARVIIGLKTALAEDVRGGVDQPGAMQPVDDAQAESPQEHGQSAKGQQRQSSNHHRDPMIRVQPPVELVASQIRRVLGHDLVVVIGLMLIQPMCAQNALARGVRITRLIRFHIERCVPTQNMGPPSSVMVPQTAKKYSSQRGH